MSEMLHAESTLEAQVMQLEEMCRQDADGMLRMLGADPDNSFECQLAVRSHEGSPNCFEFALRIAGSNRADIFLAGSTGYLISEMGVYVAMERMCAGATREVEPRPALDILQLTATAFINDDGEYEAIAAYVREVNELLTGRKLASDDDDSWGC